MLNYIKKKNDCAFFKEKLAIKEKGEKELNKGSGGSKYYYKLNNKHIKRSYRAFKDEIIWVGTVVHIS